jgi:hypothetical protein
MKKNIAVFVLFILFVNATSFGQTKAKPTLEQTVNWIVEKFNAYGVSYFFCIDGKMLYQNHNYKFSYKPSNKQIIAEYKRTVFGDAVGDILTTDEITKIPINSINKIEYVETNECRGSDHINKFIGIATYNPIDYIRIPIDISQENNLLDRLQKAFADLKSYFPKKQETY